MTPGYGIEVDALVLRNQREPMATERIWLRDIGPDDVRVRIDVVGLCHSDLSLARGVLAQPLPAVLGHEACGTVVEIGSAVSDIVVGDRVILLWITPCRSCRACQRGEPNLCEAGSSRSTQPHAVDAHGEPVYPGLTVGAFAQQTVVPAAAVVHVPDDITSEAAALLGCAVTTGVGAVTKTAKVSARSSVAVIGLGGVGLAAVQGAKLVGAAPIVAIDRNPDKAALAQSAGADHFVTADDDTRKAVRALTGGDGVDFAFDCAGSSATIREAWSMTRRGGTTVVVGIGGKDDMVSFSALELFHFARTLTGCVAGGLDAPTDLPRLFDHVRSGALDVGGLVSGLGGLDDVEAALAAMADGRGARTLIRPNAR